MGDFGYSDPKSVSDIFKYTSGSILYVDANGVFQQDNSNLFFDAATKALLVGGQLQFKAGTGFKGIFTHANGADRTYTLPNATGTVAILELAQTWTAAQTFQQTSIMTGGFKTTNLFVREYDANTIAVRNLADNAFKNLYVDIATMETALYANEIRTKGGVNAITFTQATGVSTFGANVSIGANKLLMTIHQIWESASVVYIEPRTAPDQPHVAIRPPSGGADVIFTVSRLNDVITNYEYMRLQSGGGGAWTFSQLAGGSGSLRGLNFNMGATTYLAVAASGAMTFGANVNMGGFAISNSGSISFVSNTPTIGWNAASLGAVSTGSGDWVRVAGGQGFSVQGQGYYFDVNSFDKTRIISSAGAILLQTSNNATESLGTATTRLQIGRGATVTIDVVNADLSIAANKFKTTSNDIYEISGTDFGTIVAIRRPANGNGDLLIAPIGSGTTANLYLTSTVSLTNTAMVTAGINATDSWIDSSRTGSGTSLPFHIRVQGNNMIGFTAALAMNFNNRAVSNFNAGGNEIAGIANLKGNSGSNLYIYTVGNADLIRLVTRDNVGAETERFRLNANAAQGSAGIIAYETLYFGANATGFAYASKPAITASGAAGNLILNAPSGQTVILSINGGGVLDANATTFTYATDGHIYGAAYWELSERGAPGAPAANKVRIYAEDNGSGKTRLMALFPTGAAQQIAIEP